MYYIELDRAGFYFGISNYDEFIRSDDIVECNTLPNVEGTYDIHSYRFVNGLWVFDSGRQAKINKLQIERAKDEKIEELTQESKRTISKGIDVELSDGKHHFSLEDKDIIGIEMMYKDALDNFELLVWHADGEECKNYSKEDIKPLKSGSSNFEFTKTGEITIDDIRKKAYGTLEDELEINLLKENVKEEPKKDELDMFDELEDMDSLEELNNLDHTEAKLLKDVKQDKIEEKKDDDETLDLNKDDLFDLIDSMYEKRGDE